MSYVKPLDVFIVHIPKRINDTIEIGGVQMYVDTRFNEFEYRVNEGEVVGVPMKYDTGVSVGDTLYFHHHVVMNDGQPLTGYEDTYVVRYDNEYTVNSQAIAFKDEYGQIFSLSGWTVLSPVEPEKIKSEQVLTVDLEEDQYVRGQIAYPFAGMTDLGLAVGDVVGFPPNRDYELKIEGDTYFRVRKEDLLYKL
jgi:hypothetical protein